MIQKTLDVSAEEALNGTTAAHILALQQGANILRVHDVREAKEAVKFGLYVLLYNLGFLSIGIIDVLEILIVAVIQSIKFIDY